MSNYSDILFLTGAMIVFSMLTLNTALNFQSTSRTVYQTDIEHRAITLAQDEIESIRWASEDELDPNDSNYIYDGQSPVTRTIKYGSSNEYEETYELKRSSTLISNTGGMKRYRVQIIVESDAVTPAISDTLEYIKSFKQ